jgi:hypothetical protein
MPAISSTSISFHSQLEQIFPGANGHTANCETIGIALYRALLIQCPKIPLPPEALVRGPVNPIKHLIRKKFKQNVFVTSPAQVVKLLEFGYAVSMCFTGTRYFLG